MEDTLSSAKSSLRTFTVVWAAVFVFAASAEVVDKYEMALSELQVIVDDLGDNYVSKLVAIGVAPIIVQKLKKAEEEVSRQVGFRMRITESTIIQTNLFVLSEQPDKNPTMRKLRDTLHPQYSVSAKLIWPHQEELVKKIVEAVGKWEAPPSGTVDVEKMIIRRASQPGAKVPDLGPQSRTQAIMEIFCDKLEKPFRLFVHCMPSETLHQFNLRSLFLKSKAAKKLVARVNGRVVILPHLKSVWKSVENSTAKEAFYVMEQKDAAEKFAFADFKLFGFSVKPSLAAIAGPLATLAFLLFFRAHVSHALKGTLNSADLQNFCWVAIYDDWQSKVITIVSILIGPIAANLWLILICWRIPSASLVISVMSVVLFLGVTALSWDAYWKVTTMQSKIHFAG
jgi:hypothetical protein